MVAARHAVPGSGHPRRLRRDLPGATTAAATAASARWRRPNVRRAGAPAARALGDGRRGDRRASFAPSTRAPSRSARRRGRAMAERRRPRRSQTDDCSRASRARARCACGSATARVDRGAAADLRAAALLRGVPARPRLHRGARHHRADLRHLPGRLPDERRARDGEPSAASRSPASCARCAGCSTAASGSRATRCTSSCCTRRTSSAIDERDRDGARPPRRSSSDALALKKAGNEVMRVVGGREVHPINLRVGGFYRAPRRRELATLVEPARAGARDRAGRGARWTAGLRLPRLRPGLRARRAVAARRVPDRPRPHRLEQRASTSRRPSTSEHFVEEHVPRSHALHSQRVGRRQLPRRAARTLRARPSTQLTPLAREARRRGRASSAASATRSAASSCGRSSSVYAVDEALALIAAYEEPDAPAVEVAPRAGVGLRRHRGAARAALPPLRDRRRRHDP